MESSVFERIKIELARCREVENHSSPISVDKHPELRQAEAFDWINLASSDYLGVASEQAMMQAFFASLQVEELRFEATGSMDLEPDAERDQLEARLQALYGSRAVLVFGSAYHANMCILSALAGSETCVFVDQRVHPTLADGIHLSDIQACSYPHNDLASLRTLLTAASSRHADQSIIVVTESIFGDQGDLADLRGLVALKREFPHVLLYLDEGQAVGVRGPTGLGLAEETDTLQSVDFLVGTFGKALASTGAFLSTNAQLKDGLKRRMNALLRNNALPPINLRWTRFVVEQLAGLDEQRRRLDAYRQQVGEAVSGSGRVCTCESHIIAIVFDTNLDAVAFSQRLMESGFYAMQSFSALDSHETGCVIRLLLTAAISQDAVDRLVGVIAEK